jgi:2-dehydropantoate 2-reductase
MAVEARRYRVAVIGPGALGLFYASRLSRVVPTAVIARSSARAARLRAGVRVGAQRYRPDAFGPGDLPRADWVVVLVKGYDTAAAVRIARRMRPLGAVSLQNGLVEALPQGVSMAAAYRHRGRVVPVTPGRTLLPPGFATLAGYLRAAGFPAEVTRAIAAARYRKLLANVSLNPVTALFGLRNAEVRKNPYKFFVEALAREAAQVLSAAGFRVGERRAVADVMKVASATARNRSSMLQDVLAGRRTEIEQLNGAVLRLAKRHGVPAPSHRAIYTLINVMQARLESSSHRR